MPFPDTELVIVHNGVPMLASLVAGDLARHGVPAAAAARYIGTAARFDFGRMAAFDFDPDQARAEDGKWTAGGGSGASGGQDAKGEAPKGEAPKGEAPKAGAGTGYRVGPDLSGVRGEIAKAVDSMPPIENQPPGLMSRIASSIYGGLSSAAESASAGLRMLSYGLSQAATPLTLGLKTVFYSAMGVPTDRGDEHHKALAEKYGNTTANLVMAAGYLGQAAVGVGVAAGTAAMSHMMDPSATALNHIMRGLGAASVAGFLMRNVPGAMHLFTAPVLAMAKWAFGVKPVGEEAEAQEKIRQAAIAAQGHAHDKASKVAALSAEFAGSTAGDGKVTLSQADIAKLGRLVYRDVAEAYFGEVLRRGMPLWKKYIHAGE